MQVEVEELRELMELKDMEADELNGLVVEFVTRLGAMLKMADESIRQAQERHPDKRERFNGAIALLEPSGHMMHVEDETYLSHCQELLERVAAGEDLTLGTHAEMLVHFVGLDSETIDKHFGRALYPHLFGLVFGKIALEETIGKAREEFVDAGKDAGTLATYLDEFTGEPCNGYFDAAIHWLRYRLREPSRGKFVAV